MFIQTETTPNPNTLKFIPGVEVMAHGTATFNELAAAQQKSPLAAALLLLKGVEGVFFGADFITVTKAEQDDWQVIKTPVLSVIMEHFVAGKPVLAEGAATTKTDEDYSEEDAELVGQIRELIESRVRPAVAQDGGDIIFRGFRDGVVKLELYGACSGCPSSRITLKNGIENMLKYYVPEVTSVEAVE